MTLYGAALEELRRDRARIDQVIVALEHLVGAKPVAEPPAVTYVAVPEAPSSRRALPAAKPRRGRPKKASAPKPEREHGSAGWAKSQERSESDDAAVLKAVARLRSATRDQVVKASGVSVSRVSRAKIRLEQAELLSVTGRARAARWSLATKEAP